jgi:type II secretory pathway predicted ATPase ExeA/cell division septation protein DedD
MYISHYSLAEKPFQISTDPKFLWLSEIHKEALAVLEYGVMNRNGILVLTGDAGTGKTTLINALLEGLDRDVVVAKIAHSKIDLMGFLSLVGQSFCISERFDNVEDFIFHFTNFLERKFLDDIRVLLIIDEAHKLSQEILEQIRLLSNIELAGENLISIYLVGQNELIKKLLSRECRALRQRITIHYQIKPLSEYETLQYCLHRLKVAGSELEIFDQKAIREIYRFSRGYPRLINIICDQALIAGYAEGILQITPAMIRECSDELRLPGEYKIKVKHGPAVAFLSAFNYFSHHSLQLKISAIFYQIKKRTTHSLDYFFNQFIAKAISKLSKGLAHKKGDRPEADGIKIAETRNSSFRKTRRHKQSVFSKEYSWLIKTQDGISRFMQSGSRNTALAVCSVALALMWSLWYQGIFSTDSNLPISGNSAVRPDIPAFYETGYPDTRLAESNAADRTKATGFVETPWGKFELTEPDLEEKHQVNDLNAFNKVAINTIEDTKETEASINKTDNSPISVQKSTRADRQDAGKSGASSRLPNRSEAAYAIQVGAFLKKANAMKLASILGKKGYSANIVNFNDEKGRVWHTVRIGEYGSQGLAEKHARDFSSEQGLDSIVRPIDRF